MLHVESRRIWWCMNHFVIFFIHWSMVNTFLHSTLSVGQDPLDLTAGAVLFLVIVSRSLSYLDRHH
jgi:hypothetical protein